jgi:uncharacterized repeat protein (TIGR03803 family)
MAVLIGALLATRMPCGAATSTLTTLYSFTGAEGAFPQAGLALNSGALFGTTYAGGLGWGTVFELSKSGGAWNINQLYTFTGGADGANPQAGVVFNSSGAIFGTTEQGGTWGYGTVFSLTPGTGGTWTYQVLYSFTGPGSDGANPEAGLVLSKSGVLYGTTYGGGGAGWGTVFSLTPRSGGAWTEKVLYSFAGAPTGCGTAGNPVCDGANPLAALTAGSGGVLYGTTYGGGGTGWGTVFSLALQPGGWTETVLYSFNGAPSGANGGSACGTSGQPACDGGAPAGSLVLNAATGVFYGTTTLGGKPTGCPLGGYQRGCGAVFQLTPPAPPSTTWTESLLYTFAGPSKDGMLPSDNLALASKSGALYGTAFAGGSSADTCFPASYTGCGMVYELQPPTPPSTTWTKTNLAKFNNINGGGPNGVILSPTGKLLYGTTYVGGASGGYEGTIFEVTF